VRRIPAALAVAALAWWASAAACRAADEPPLQALALSTVGAGQGVYAVAADGRVLAAEAAERAVHPASVTKIATTLALLQRLGPDHRFVTTLIGGRPRDGLVPSDLVVQASGDPFLVFEGAFMMLRRLHALGVRAVDGRLVVQGPLLFDWQRDPAGTGLARALRGARGADAWAAVPGDPALTLRQAALAFHGRGVGDGSDPQPLLTYRSPPLLMVLKALNGYSNNVFHFASDAIGGPSGVEATVRASVAPELRDEIRIVNAAGGGSQNRISPRAVVAILAALERELTRHGRTFADVLPVSGIDSGTLRERLLAPPAGRGFVVGKTGTFGSEGACALAGALRTKRYGVITFAVLNRGVPVPDARRRQDAFVAALAAATHAEPWAYATAAPPAFTAAEVQ
jgi:D-alanyl-D-alanine carboxypeptidase/D-alanyl-D-alanine-endopeptidase (penicillin-binding protein 4)